MHWEEVENLKNSGNNYYKKKDYNNAIIYYTEGLKLDNNNDDLYLNRGLSYKKLNNYEKAIDDAQSSIELNINNIKAHILMGQSLLCKSKSNRDIKIIDTAITRLSKAFGLCSGQNKQGFEQTIENIKKRAKKLKYFIISENDKVQREIDYNKLKDTIENDYNLTENLKDNKIKNLEDIFKIYSKTKILPDFLKCSLSNKIFIDPVLLPTGYSYERSYIIQYLQNNNNIDPLGNNIKYTDIYDNINLKHYIDYYLQENPWAFEVDYNTIELINFN